MNTLLDVDINIINNIARFLDNETKYHLLNYYYVQELDRTGDEEYVYQLECLYEWWKQEKLPYYQQLFLAHDSDSYDNDYGSD